MKSNEELRAAIAERMPPRWEVDGDDPEFRAYVIDGFVALIRKIIREELMGLKELRARLGVKSSAASMRVWRGGGPPVAGRIAATRFWLRPDVEEWIAENPKAVRHHDAQEAS
jgi:hypothetical protein